MKANSPAFQFYPADHLGSARAAMLSLEEEGAYFRAICFCWNNGSIPADLTKLAKLIGKGASTTVLAAVASMFEPDASDPTKLVHDRLDAEREKQRRWREKSSLGGKRSAKTRANPRVVEGWLPNGTNQNATLQSSSSSSNITPIVPKGDEGAAASPSLGGVEEVSEKKITESEEAKLVGELFQRRQTTGWSEKEIKALKRARPNMDDLQLVAEYYRAERRKKPNYLRTTIEIFLNNFPGEVDRAHAWKDDTLHVGASGAGERGPLALPGPHLGPVPDPPDWQEWLEAKGHRYKSYEYAPRWTREDYRRERQEEVA